MAEAVTIQPAAPGGSASVAAPAWGRWATRSLLVLAAIMCLYVGASVWAKRADLAGASGKLPWHVIPSVIGLVFLGWGLRSLRWHYYVKRLGWPVPLHHSLLAFFASFAFTATPGKAGEVVKSVLLRTRYNVPLADGAGVLLVERLGDLLAVLVLAAGGLTLMADGVIYFVLAVLMVGGIGALVSSRAVYYPLLMQIERIGRLAGLADKLLRLLDTGRRLLRPAPLLAGVGIALVAWSCEGWAFHVLMRGFGVAITPVKACSIFGIATLFGALCASPGGVGGFEGVMLWLLSRLGLPVAAATLPIVLFRFCTLWLTSLLGFGFLLWWRGSSRRKEAPFRIGAVG
jgi:uncharacterized membrane protein YbhN (UPF0104 family)